MTSRFAVALTLLAGCVPGPPARCEAGSERPRCPIPEDLFARTRYEAVCGEAYTNCSYGIEVVAPKGRPTCDPEAPELGPMCPSGWVPYCHFADCREREDP